MNVESQDNLGQFLNKMSFFLSEHLGNTGSFRGNFKKRESFGLYRGCRDS